MICRLATQLDIPVVASGTAAVLALRVLGAERVTLVGAPWFSRESNELGSAYFRSQGFDVVDSRSADLPPDPGSIDTRAEVDWICGHLFLLEVAQRPTSRDPRLPARVFAGDSGNSINKQAEKEEADGMEHLHA